MSQRIIECVPNFSEGRDKAVIRQITAAIETSGGVKLLDVDPGEATNRTVVTFVGEPEAVVEAAFAGVKRAAELIDMRRHKGAHPRMGATDVLPLIPIAGVTLAECAELARALARRIADELRIPTYCYEAAAFAPERKNLAVCRAGEYEALVVTIGKGQGHNWWCVLYPNLCFMDSVHAIVPKEGKEELRSVLTDEEYAMIVKGTPVKIKWFFLQLTE